MYQQLLPHLFRTEYQKLVAVLTRTFGLEHIELAEDIASETFLQAMETWSLKALPENPTAWLYSVAKNKAKDRLRRDATLQRIRANVHHHVSDVAELEIDLSAPAIEDAQLQMMFAICHPFIPAEAQVGLALRILCGFGIDEIASAFLSSKETINKRLFRAKEKLRGSGIRLELPSTDQLAARLDTVLVMLYLLFNEGYYSAAADNNIRKDCCLEAMRLCYLLSKHTSTATLEVHALLALMCFQASRLEARTGSAGELIPYDRQDNTRWDQQLITRGRHYLHRSTQKGSISRYQLQASIAHWHTLQEDSSQKWNGILQLYNRLLQLEYSPIAALNRTYALAKVQGKRAAIQEAEKLGLKHNHLYHSLLGELYTDIDNFLAAKHLREAINLCCSTAEKNLLLKKIAELRLEEV